MSTKTAQSAFALPGADKLPTLLCSGTLEEIGDPTVSSKQQYYIVRLRIKGAGTSRDTRPMLLLRPDWFRPGYNPDEAAAGESFVYRNTIAASPTDKRVPTLLGLCGEDEAAYIDLSNRLFSAVAGIPRNGAGEFDEDAEIQTVVGVMRDLLADEDHPFGKHLGYQLRQQVKKNDDGTKTRTQYYEVGGWFRPDEKSYNYWSGRAAKAPGDFIVMFDPTMPF